MSQPLTLNYYILHNNDGKFAKLSVEHNQELSDIRNSIYQKHKRYFVDEASVQLYKPENLRRESGGKALLERVKANISALEPLADESSDPISNIFSDDDLREKEFIHLVAVPGMNTTSTEALLESAMPVPDNLAAFLQSTTLPSRAVLSTVSSKTHVYDTIRVSVQKEDVPFYLIRFDEMVSSMVEDLFGRVLPTYTNVDSLKLIHAVFLARYYTEVVAPNPIEHEPSVWNGTHYILDTCVACLRAVGLDFKRDTEKWNKFANVQIDSVVTKSPHGGGLAIEDKTPKVFKTYCTDENIDSLCKKLLELEKLELGFRSIFFRLTIYMVQEQLRWGLINCGTHMRIVRIEFKTGRPFVIISRQIPTDTPPPDSVYSLICYMLLTCDSMLSIFNGIQGDVPEPPLTVNHAGPQTRTQSWKKQKTTFPLSENVTSMVFHTTAAAGSISVDIPMVRIDKPQAFVSDVQSADVHVVDFLGAGSFGRIFLADLFVHDLYYGQVVVKLANADLEEYLETEARTYNRLRNLYGVGIPRFYGLFRGENAGIKYWCILIDFCGDPVKTIENLPLSQRFEIFRTLLMIHQQGVMHNDFSPMNILQRKSDIWLIDFSVAIIDHECSGIESCRELTDAATELRLAPLYI